MSEKTIICYECGAPMEFWADVEGDFYQCTSGEECGIVEADEIDTSPLLPTSGDME